MTLKSLDELDRDYKIERLMDSPFDDAQPMGVAEIVDILSEYAHSAVRFFKKWLMDTGTSIRKLLLRRV